MIFQNTQVVPDVVHSTLKNLEKKLGKNVVKIILNDIIYVYYKIPCNKVSSFQHPNSYSVNK